jgi:hypothetical protein
LPKLTPFESTASHAKRHSRRPRTDGSPAGTQAILEAVHRQAEEARVAALGRSCRPPPSPAVPCSEMAILSGRKGRDQAERLLEDIKAQQEEFLSRASELVRSLRETFDDARQQHTDEEVEAVAAERVRSGAAEDTEDGRAALAELDVHP